MPTAHLLDYVAGNVRSLVNAIEKVGYTVEWIKEPKDVEAAEVGVAYHFDFVICLCILSIIQEAYSAWRGAFRSLSNTVQQGWLSRTYSQAHPVWQAIYGYLCWLAGTI